MTGQKTRTLGLPRKKRLFPRGSKAKGERDVLLDALISHQELTRRRRAHADRMKRYRAQAKASAATSC